MSQQSSPDRFHSPFVLPFTTARIVDLRSIAAGVMVGALIALNPLAAAAVDKNITVPFTFTSGALAGCLDETVDVSGNLHMVYTVEDKSDGGKRLNIHYNLEGVTGKGRTTGTKYQGTGVTRLNENFKSPYPSTLSASNKFKLIGQGSASNFTLDSTIQFTVNANGDLTAKVMKISSGCR